MRNSSFALVAAILSSCAAHLGAGAGRATGAEPASAGEKAAAAAAWRGRCELGFAVDCRKLGRALLIGDGVPPDDRLAAAYLLKACEIGEPASCSDLGVLTLLGRGVAQDDASGGALTRRACGAGYALACSNLATLTVEGVNKLNLRPDQEGEGGRQLLGAFLTACDAGALEGCLNLGSARERGDPEVRVLAGAVSAYQRACSGGLAIACHRLALLIHDDPGVAPGVDPRAAAPGLAKQVGGKAGRVFEHALRGLRFEEIRHDRHDVRLGDGLSVTDRQRAVFIGHVPQILGHQFMPWHRRHGFKDPGVERLLVERFAGQANVRRDFRHHGQARRPVRIVAGTGHTDGCAQRAEQGGKRSAPCFHGHR